MPVLPLNAVVGNRYRIEKLVGAGGMGEVYRAINLQTRAPVAVKALTTTGESDTALARFRNEAVIQYNLRHPNVAELYEYFEYQGKPCIAMEFVEGRTLDEWIREAGALEPGRALEILADICDAVSYMHSKGTIHRDIKSENIRVNAQGKAKLLDFGISVSRETPVLTRVGFSIGTPEKMAPEQHRGLRGDARSDVWALGILLYEMMTGALPFANNNPAGLREDIIAVRYIPAAKRKPGLPKAVVRMISTCLQLKPDERYSSSGTMLREVQQLRRRLASERWKQALFSKPAGAAAGLVLLLLLLFIYALSPPGDVKKPGGKESAESPAVPLVSSSGAPISTSSVPDRAPVRTRARPQPLPSSPVSNSRAKPSAPIPAQGEPNSALDSNAAEQTTVRLATYDGPADVTDKDGQLLGSTPYPLTGPLGKSYQLWLRRPGFQPRRVDVQINNNKREYLFGLEKIEGQSDFGKKE
jgi:serine/threonine protein kinase